MTAPATVVAPPPPLPRILTSAAPVAQPVLKRPSPVPKPSGDLFVRRAPDPAVERLANEVRAMVAAGRLTPYSAAAIVKAAVAAGARPEVVEEVVTEIAKGQDGIGGTADDLIPLSTLEALRALLRAGVVRDMAEWLAPKARSWFACLC